VGLMMRAARAVLPLTLCAAKDVAVLDNVTACLANDIGVWIGKKKKDAEAAGRSMQCAKGKKKKSSRRVSLLSHHRHQFMHSKNHSLSTSWTGGSRLPVRPRLSGYGAQSLFSQEWANVLVSTCFPTIFSYYSFTFTLSLPVAGGRRN